MISVLEGQKFILLPEPERRHSYKDNSQATGGGTGKYGIHDRFIFKCKPVDVWPSARSGHIRMGAIRPNAPFTVVSSYTSSLSFDGVCGLGVM